MKYSTKIYKNNKVVQTIRSSKIRSFLKKIRSVNFKEQEIKVYLKVESGILLDNFGKYSKGDNEGTYDNHVDFWHAFNAFTEK